jgi:cytochrome P450
VSLFILDVSGMTRSVLTWSVFELTQQPLLVERLQKEVKAASHPYNQCPFLDACIDETLRLWPPVPSGLQVVTPSQGLDISKAHRLPPNTILSAPTYALHRDPVNFSSPDDYQPARWLSRKGTNKSHHNTDAFVPFGYGHAVKTLEESVVRLQCRAILARFFQSYDITLATEGNTPDDIRGRYRDHGFAAKTPCMVRIRAR